MKIVKIIFYLLLILIGISFAVLNASLIKINLYLTTLTVPLSVLVIVLIAIGIFFGYFLGLLKVWRLKNEIRQVKNQLRLTEKEIKNLRSIPLSNDH